MAFLFGGKKAKTPGELVKHLKESLQVFDKTPTGKNAEKAAQEVSGQLAAMKFVLYGDNEHEPRAEDITQLVNEMHSNDVMPLLVQHIDKFEFEAKKDAALIFNNLLRRQIGSRYTSVDYICKNPSVLYRLVKGYEINDIALNTGTMLRECVRHEALAKLIFYAEDQEGNFWKFFKFVEMSNFDVASDAFATFKELLTKHKALSAEFLEKNYDAVFAEYKKLLNSENYVTRRQSLKLLGELLLDRSNFNIMTKYISSPDNLKLMMMLLRDKSRSIQFEAFHVFKVFVANPNKTKEVLHILIKNKEKLVAFLNHFHNDKEDDQFNDEKAFLLKQIQSLPMSA